MVQHQHRTVDQRVRIVRTVEANVEVAGDVDRCRVGGELLENSTKFAEEQLLNRHRFRSTDDSDVGHELSSNISSNVDSWATATGFNVRSRRHG